MSCTLEKKSAIYFHIYTSPIERYYFRTLAPFVHFEFIYLFIAIVCLNYSYGLWINTSHIEGSKTAFSSNDCFCILLLVSFCEELLDFLLIHLSVSLVVHGAGAQSKLLFAMDGIIVFPLWLLLVIGGFWTYICLLSILVSWMWKSGFLNNID